MECESTFNPYADNGIAYGLMQLVPRSGAHDAALTVFGQKQDVPAHKLKNAEINANLGTALLMQYMTWDGWLGKYKDNKYKWETLAIAAYNAGCGRALEFVRKNPGAMVDTDVNFFKALHNFLPDETKHYIHNVPKARLQYKGL
jgi:soluble lytic murein transglycosylase-like protein